MDFERHVDIYNNNKKVMETLIYLNHMKKQSKIPTEPRMGVKPTNQQNFAARVATGNINEHDQIIPMKGVEVQRKC